MKHRLGPVLLALLLAAISTTACGRGESAPDGASSSQISSESSSEADFSVEPIEGEIPTLTPPYTLSNFISLDLDGNVITHDIFSKSELTMVYVWAIGSDQCIEDMPTILDIAEDNTKKDVQTIGIIADLSDKKEVEATSEAVRQAGINFTQLLPTEELCEAKLYAVTRVPLTFFVDSKGNQVGEDHTGKAVRSSWGKMVDSYLKKEKK
mgnify:CR=1 FL=1